MADDGQDICGPCDYRGEVNNATNFCVDCKELLCADCFVHHNSHRQSRTHLIIAAEENKILEALDVPLNEHCDEHDQIKDLYCSSHDEVVCLICSQTNHVKCEPSARLSDAAQNSKSSTFMTVLEEEITGHIKSCEDIVNDREGQYKTLSIQKDEIMDTIRNVRTFVNKKLDHLEEEIEKKLNDEYDKAISEINKTKDLVHCHLQELKTMEDHINVLKSLASNTQTFIGIRHLSNMVRQNEEKFASYVGIVKDFSLQILQNQDIVKTISSTKSFGDIKVETADAKIQLARIKSLQSPSVSLSAEVEISKKQIIRLPQETLFKSIILSCGMISNNQLIFVDSNVRNKKLIIHEQDGTHVRNIELTSKPFDISVIGSDKVALTFPWSTRKRVEIINTTNFSTENAVHFRNRCYGVSNESGKLYVIVKTEGIFVLDLTGKFLRSLPIEGNGIYYVHVKSDLLYCSNEKNDTVLCYDLKGTFMWQFQDLKLISPRAITSGDDGYIFIAGFKSNSVVTLDKDGNFKQQISGVGCGLNSPTGLSFSEDQKLLLVCNSSNSQGILFDIV